MITAEVTEMWRIGPHRNALRRPLARLQGTGRFDDPARNIGVAYFADSLETCLYELMNSLSIDAHPRAGALRRDVARATTPQEAADLDRDIAIAMRLRVIPPWLFTMTSVKLRVAWPLLLYDLRNVENRTSLEDLSEVQKEMRCHGFPQLDGSAILSEFRPLTQAISRHVMLAEPDTGPLNGILCNSRHSGVVYAIFDDRLDAGTLDIMAEEDLTPSSPFVQKVAYELKLKVTP